MRVVVTGGSGRIGSVLVRALADRGHVVTSLDRRPPATTAANANANANANAVAAAPVAAAAAVSARLTPSRDVAPAPPPAATAATAAAAGGSVGFVQVDLLERDTVRGILAQADALCHLGEIPNEATGVSPPEVYAHNTRVGAIVLQAAAELKLRRVIYTSSCQAYGMWETPRVPPLLLPFDETHPLRPQNHYSLAKAAMEGYARLMAEQAGLSVAAFRFPWVLQDPYSQKMASWAVNDPEQTNGFASYLHVTDAASAYLLALEHPRPGFEAYHFSAAEVLSVTPLAERLKKHHPDYPPLPPDWPPFKSPILIAKARAHFGWEPQWNFLDFHREPGARPR